jgi:hypothetical protein
MDKQLSFLVYADEYVLEFEMAYLDDEYNLKDSKIKSMELFLTLSGPRLSQWRKSVVLD